MAEILKLANISIDPAKIKDRWGLGALALVIWLLIIYVVVKSVVGSALSLTIIISTLLLLLFTLFLLFRGESPVVAAASPNILPSRAFAVPRQGPMSEAERIRAVLWAKQMIDSPELKELWGTPTAPSEPKKKNKPEN